MGYKFLGKSPQKAAIISSCHRIKMRKQSACRLWLLRITWKVEIKLSKAWTLIKSQWIQSCSFLRCITTNFRGALRPKNNNSSLNSKLDIKRVAIGSSQTWLKGEAYCFTETQAVSVWEAKFSAKSVNRGSKPMDSRIAWRRRLRIRALPLIKTWTNNPLRP